MSQFGIIEFVNKTAEKVMVIMLDEDGTKYELPILEPGDSTSQISPANVAWVVVHDDFMSERLQVAPGSNVAYAVIPTVRLEKLTIQPGRGGDL